MKNFEKVEIYYIDITINSYFELSSDRECYYTQLAESIIGLYGDIKILYSKFLEKYTCEVLFLDMFLIYTLMLCKNYEVL